MKFKEAKKCSFYKEKHADTSTKEHWGMVLENVKTKFCSTMPHPNCRTKETANFTQLTTIHNTL